MLKQFLLAHIDVYQKTSPKLPFRSKFIFKSEVLRAVFHRLLFACASTSTITKDELMLKKLGQLSQ